MSCPNLADGVEAPVHLKRSSCYREKERKEGETKRRGGKNKECTERRGERERILKETEDERRRDERGDNN